MDVNKFDRVYIHPDSVNSPVACRVRDLFESSKIQVTNEPPQRSSTGSLSPAEFDLSKKQIWIAPFKGSFFKRCPGSKPGLACCNYFVLNLGLQCNMNCSYCYLQSFLNSPYLTIYSNIDEALIELRAMAEEFPNHSYRVGTGETIDSLSLDPLTLYSRDLISFFKEFPNWSVEFKTKSDLVDQFLDIEHAGNAIVSWSVNPKEIVESEELETASLERRLMAAEKCSRRGFPIAFHMDPMIWRPDWKPLYNCLVDEICERFQPEQTRYVSLGALRFQPEQKNMMRERFSFQSWVLRAETHRGSDGKLRYDKLVRKEMFQHVISRFKNHNPGWKVFLCMETPETWMDTFQEAPARMSELKPLFKHLPEQALKS